MDLSNVIYPDVTGVDMAFPTFDTIPELVEEANKRTLTKGRAKFNELFFEGGQFELQDDVIGTWKEKAFIYARALMGSFKPSQEDKEAVCALIFEETLKLHNNE